MVSIGLLALGSCTEPSASEDSAVALDGYEPAVPRDEAAIPQVEPPPFAGRKASALVVEQIVPGLVRAQGSVLTELGLDVAEGSLSVQSGGDTGWRLTTLGDDTIAARVGLAAGDYVTMINGVVLRDLSGLREAFMYAEGEGRVVVAYLRAGESRELEVLLTSEAEPSQSERLSTFCALVARGTRILDERHRTFDRALLEPLSRLSAMVDPDELWPRLWIPPEVTVKLVGGKEVATRSERAFAFSSLAGSRTFEITGVDKDAKARVFEYEVTEGAVTEVAIARATEGIRARPRRRFEPEVKEAEGDSGAESAEITVTCSEEGRCELSRTELDELLANPAKLSKQMRVLPHLSGGKPEGFKLFGIRPMSLPSRLGFKNGDVLRAVNEVSIRKVDEALSVYTKVRRAETLTFSLLRRGEETTVEVKIVP